MQLIRFISVPIFFFFSPSIAFALDASISIPETGDAGGTLVVHWTGPDGEGDYITIVERGASEGSWDKYVYTSNGSPLVMSLPAEPGEYQVRYSDGSSYATLASADIEVTRPEVKILAPDSAGAGSQITIEWVGPNGPNDFITVVPSTTPEGSWKNYTYTREGSPMTLDLPAELGVYEIRYAHGSSYQTMGKATINLMDASATVKVPGQVQAGKMFSVDWLGPNNSGDYLTIVKTGATEGSWGEYVYTKRGNPAQLMAPKEPGSYEVRYAMGRSYATLARGKIEVTPGDIGTLVVSKPMVDFQYSSVEVVLDASGSMLKVDDVMPRYELASQALENFIYLVPVGRQFALRAFGHLKINSCDTSLKMPLQPIVHEKAIEMMKSIRPMQLAKTPIADSINRVAGDLANTPGKKLVVLVTDGEETCGGSVEAAITNLVSADPLITVHVVGFAIDEQFIKSDFERWANIGGGRYLDAMDSTALAKSLKSVVHPTYKLLGGDRIYIGTLNEGELEVPAGEYLLYIEQGENSIEKTVEVKAGETSYVNL